MTAEAQKGNAFAMHDLGKMLLSGVGCDENAEEAHEWFRKALDGLKTALTKEQNQPAQTPKEQAKNQTKDRLFTVSYRQNVFFRLWS